MRYIVALLAILGIPVLAFMIMYSIDIGCFICLYGEQRGGLTERIINIVIVMSIIITLIHLCCRLLPKK